MTEATVAVSHMEVEIREQPAVARRILAEGRETIRGVAHAIRQADPKFVVLVARGTSDNAALYARYLIETRLGLPCALASPSAVTVYGAKLGLGESLVVAFSQSGESPDLATYIETARAAGATTLAITNADGSTLEREAELHVPLLAGPERSVAATKSYLAEMLVAYLLIESIAGVALDATSELPHLLDRVLGLEPSVQALGGRLQYAQHVLLTSRGYNFATAQEAALKLIEAANLPAHAFSSADLMHGPVAMVDSGFPVIAIVPGGPGGVAMRPALDALRQRGAEPILVTSDGSGLEAEASIVVPRAAEALSPLLFAVPLQMLAFHVGRLRGINSDAPRGLSKVTRTL